MRVTTGGYVDNGRQSCDEVDVFERKLGGYETAWRGGYRAGTASGIDMLAHPRHQASKSDLREAMSNVYHD